MSQPDMMSSASTCHIPLVDLSLQHAEIAAEVAEGIERVISTGAFVLGPDVTEFEREFAEYCGVAHCVGVANGTDAIELALRAIGVGPSDEVIIPANTFAATAGGVVRAGATPALVDCDPRYLLIDAQQIEARITSKTKAIIPVHMYGQLAPMPELLEIAQRYGLRVVEDGAQSQGADRDGRRSGAWGDLAATSFYPGKNLGAYGDGGAVLTDDSRLAGAVQRLRNHGGTAKYQHDQVGFNSRLDTMQAAFLRAKLRRLDKWNDLRREAAERYDDLLAGVPGVTRPAVSAGNLHVWHLYVVRVPRRDEVLARLNDGDVSAGIHYPVPIHLLGAYVHLGSGPGTFPNAERLAGEILSLPIYPGITPVQQERVVEHLAEALR
jgi:dTDP-4-amino-4,6-dideoxygalactose transaminase